MASKLVEKSTIPPARATPEFSDAIKKLIYTTDTLLQHELEESDVTAAFDNFLKHLSTPPIYTSILTNTLLASRDDTITQLYKILSVKHDYIIEKCSFVPECILIRSRVNQPEQIHCDTHIHALVEYRCGMAVLRGADVYAPGVTAVSSQVSAGYVVSVFCDVEGRCTRGMTCIPRDNSSFVFLGNGVLKMGRELFKGDGVKKGVCIEMTDPIYRTPSLNNLLPDRIYLQNLPSMLVAQSLVPQPGDTVLDMCAAPGGKAIHCAIKMLDKGVVIALDCKQSRVDVLRSNVDTFKLSCVRSLKFDSTKCCDVKKQYSDITMESVPPFSPRSFDKILVDAPCSGLGQRPKCFMTELTSCSEYQKQFLSQAVPLLKTGGSLVYSTCSVSPMENEANVAWVLKRWPDVRLVDVGVCAGRNGLLGYGLDQSYVEKVRRFGPPIFNELISNPIEDTIGFFIAKFTKIVID